jgi:hypothetical protein
MYENVDPLPSTVLDGKFLEPQPVTDDDDEDDDVNACCFTAPRTRPLSEVCGCGGKTCRRRLPEKHPAVEYSSTIHAPAGMYEMIDPLPSTFLDGKFLEPQPAAGHGRRKRPLHVVVLRQELDHYPSLRLQRKDPPPTVRPGR